MRFDLRDVAPQVRRVTQLGRVALLALFIGGLVLIGYVVYHFTQAGLWDELHAAAVVGLLIVDSLFGWIGVTVILPPAAWVEVDDKGVRIGYASGRILGREWSSEETVLRLYRTDGTNDWISKGRPAFGFTVDRQPFRAFLNSDAAEAILRIGRDHGLVAIDRPCGRKGWTRLDLTKASA